MSEELALAVIPARGGSTRIPGKNVREFAGKPIIAYPIQAALESALFTEVMVSTDAPEIAAIAEAWGAKAPFLRPATLAENQVNVMAVVRHALEWARERHRLPRLVCVLYATSPMLRSRDLVLGLRGLEGSGCDFALSVTRSSAPPQRAMVRRADGSLAFLFPEHALSHSQDLPETYHDAAQFCWGSATAFLQTRDTVFEKRVTPVVLPGHRVQDIDTQEDWLQAERLFESNRRAGDL